MKKNNLLAIPITLSTVTALSFIALTSPYSSADSAVDTIEVTVKTACTLSSTLGSTSGVTGSTDGNGNNTYTVTMNVEETKEINGSILTTICNDAGGYSLYAIGYSGDSYVAPNNTKMLGSNGNSISTSTSTTGSNGSWSMKLAAVSGLTPPTILNSFNNYHVVPESYTQVAKYTSVTSSASAAGSTIQAKYQIYTGNQVADTYQGKVKYTMVHPNDIVTGSTTDMQNWHGCSSLDLGSETFLRDTRDGKYYRITKFYDGKCWMTENLDLAGGTALSADDTDVTSTYINGFETGGNLTKVGNTIVLPNSSTAGFNNDSNAYVYNSGRIASSDSDCVSPGCHSYYSWIAATLGGKASDGSTAVTTDNTDVAASICPKGWHLPNTRAGTNDTSDFRKLMVMLGGNAYTQSYDSTTTPTGATIFSGLSNTPLYFLRAGSCISGSFYSGGTSGFYWSSTSLSSTNARALGFNLGGVYSVLDDQRRKGFSVRCLTE